MKVNRYTVGSAMAFPGIPTLVIATETGLWGTSPETVGLTTMGIIAAAMWGGEVKGAIDASFAKKKPSTNTIYTGAKTAGMFLVLTLLFVALTSIAQSAATMFGFMAASKTGSTMIKAYGERLEEK